MSRPLFVAGLVLACSLVAACSFNGRGRGSDNLGGQLITAETIRKSGLSTGWDVLRRYADHLTVNDYGEHPVSIGRRGRGSIYLSENPMLIVDGVKVRNFRVLATLPAREIESMRILSAMEGNIRYGIHGGDGVIIVRTLYPAPAGPEDTTAVSASRVGR